MVKPRACGDFDGWHRTPIERAAYILNLLLGLDYVPPTVYRHDLEVDGQRYEHGGAVIYFVEDLNLLQEVPEEDWGVDKEDLLSATRLLVWLLPHATVCFMFATSVWCASVPVFECSCLRLFHSVLGCDSVRALCRMSFSITLTGIWGISHGASTGRCPPPCLY